MTENQAQLAISEQLTDLNNKIDFLYRPQMEAAFPDLSLSEIQSLELIGAMENPNVTKLAESLYVTRGAISKVTKKLLKKQFIERYQSPENKKEIYFRLTTAGQAINDRHDQLHQIFLENDRPVFADLTPSDNQIILNFLKKYNQHLDKQLRNREK